MSSTLTKLELAIKSFFIHFESLILFIKTSLYKKSENGGEAEREERKSDLKTQKRNNKGKKTRWLEGSIPKTDKMSFLFKFDAAEVLQWSFQDPASPHFDEIINFHNEVIYLTFIMLGVFWILFETLREYSKSNKMISHKYMIHGTWLEIIWTVTPAFILIAIAYPSFKLIYLIDEVIDAGITIKVVGHQWYWSYEYSDYADQDGASIEFDSYMIPESDLEDGQLRLLEVDNQLVVPAHTHVRVILTSADVLHCWAIPSLGVKLDCVPGRLNQTGFLAYREGTFYGQCSEICGANHAFMPIVVKSVNLDDYCIHIESLLEEARS